MKRWQIPLAVVVSFAAGLLVGGPILRPHSRGEEKYREFCIKTKHAIAMDRRDLESPEEQRRNAAYERFYESSDMHHDDRSIMMCLEEGTMPAMDLGCRLNKDWSCLAKLAREIETKLEKQIDD